MEFTGIIRNIDALGRISVPIKLRKKFSMDVNTDVEIYTDDDSIILKKFQRTCVFCNNSEKVSQFKSKAVCHKCLENLRG